MSWFGKKDEELFPLDRPDVAEMEKRVAAEAERCAKGRDPVRDLAADLRDMNTSQGEYSGGCAMAPADPSDGRIELLLESIVDLRREMRVLRDLQLQASKQASDARHEVNLLLEFYNKEVEDVPPAPGFKRLVDRGSVKGGPERCDDSRS